MKRLGNNAVKCNQLQGSIKETESEIKLNSINLKLDSNTAWGLCNLLAESSLNDADKYINDNQKNELVNLGKAIAAFIDHPSRDFEHLKNLQGK